MRVRFQQTEANTVPWQPGEVISLQVVEVDPADGSYVCETVETFPADLKQRHAEQIAQLEADHRAALATLTPKEEPPEQAEPLN